MSKMIQGKWQFLTSIDPAYIRQPIKFEFDSNGHHYYGIYQEDSGESLYYMNSTEPDSRGDTLVYSVDTGWEDDNYRTIDLGSTPINVFQEWEEILQPMLIELIPQTIAEKLQAIAENEERVFEAGKRAEYDKFWDKYQRRGDELGGRIDYQGAFYGVGWTDNTFKPKYDIKPDNCGLMFYSSWITDLDASLKQCGVTLDTSTANRVDQMFYYSKVTNVPALDCQNVTQSGCFNNTFRNATKLETIEKIILKEDGTQTFANAFTNAKALKNITFEGVIGQNIDFKDCTLLSYDSIINIISRLSDTATDKTVTFSKTAVDASFSAQDWVSLEAWKPNWTLALE